MFPGLLPSVQIGINPLMAKNQRHGVAWVTAEDGTVSQQSFMVDKPRRLINPSKTVIDDLFKQITRMGMEPEHLEIMLNNTRQVYKYGQHKPVFVHSLN